MHSVPPSALPAAPNYCAMILVAVQLIVSAPSVAAHPAISQVPVPRIVESSCTGSRHSVALTEIHEPIWRSSPLAQASTSSPAATYGQVISRSSRSVTGPI